MKDWEKINLFQIGKYKSYFVEEYGLIDSIQIQQINLIDNDNREIRNLYTEDPNNKGVFNVARNYRIETIFDEKYYQLNEQAQSYYRYNSQITQDHVTPLNNFKYFIKYRINCLSYDRSRYDTYKDIIVSNKKEFLKYEILASQNQERYQKPILADIEKGQKYIYIHKGLCEVINVLKYPDDLPKICQVKFKNGEELTIEQGDNNFLFIPYNLPDSPLKQFNESLNELQLQPMIIWNDNFNLLSAMWQPIDGASRYIVKAYVYMNNNNNMKKLYFLKNYETDRDVHFISINDYSYKIYSQMIFVIIAENREGKIIAQSRGIKISSSMNYPQWFNNYEL